MSGINSLPGFVDVTTPELLEALGTTEFIDPDIFTVGGWVHVINGLIIQGGQTLTFTTPTLNVNYHKAFPKQLLGIFLSPIYTAAYQNWQVQATDLSYFTVVKNTTGSSKFYWLAIGV